MFLGMQYFDFCPNLPKFGLKRFARGRIPDPTSLSTTQQNDISFIGSGYVRKNGRRNVGQK